MPSFEDNAFTLLRLMYENGIIEAKPIIYSELSQLTELEEDEFNVAFTHLFSEKSVSGGGMGPTRSVWITPLGIERIKQFMNSRIPISLEAEKVLRYIMENGPPADYDGVDGTTIQEAERELGLSHDQCVKAFQQLEDYEFIACQVHGESPLGPWGAVSTPKARNAARRNFQTDTPHPQTQIGAIYQGPVNATNIANAINSQIEQTVNQNDTDAIQRAITEILDNLVRVLANELDAAQMTAYEQAVDKLKQELVRPEPDRSRIQKLITILTFGDTLNGTLDLGAKAFTVSALVAPHLPMLYAYIEQLIQSIGG